MSKSLEKVANEASADAAQPVLRETITLYINGVPTVVYKDVLEKELMKSLGLPGYDLQFGA